MQAKPALPEEIIYPADAETGRTLPARVVFFLCCPSTM